MEQSIIRRSITILIVVGCYMARSTQDYILMRQNDIELRKLEYNKLTTNVWGDK